MVNNQDVSINVNNRPNPLHDGIQYGNETVSRVASVAIPFLHFYQPTAIATHLTLGATKSWQLLKTIKQNGDNKQWSLVAQNLVVLALTASSIALSILAPTLGTVISHGSKLTTDIYHLGQAVLNRNFQEAATATLSIGHTFIYIGSSLFAAPELLAISLLSQALLELYQARNFFQNGLYFEGVAQVALASIRTYQAIPHIQTCHRNWFGKEMTQEDLDRFLVDTFFSGSKNNDLEKFLIENNFSSYLRNLNFEISSYRLLFSNIHFNHCHFKSSVHSCTFLRSSFTNCSLKSVNFFDTKFINTLLFNNDMQEGVFYLNQFHNVLMWGNDATKAHFNDSTISQTIQIGSNLTEANFLGVKAEYAFIGGSELTDTLFLNSKKKFWMAGNAPHRVTKPVIALAWNFKSKKTFADMQNKVLRRDFPVTILKFDYTPEDIDPNKLNEEVVSQLSQDVPKGAISRPEALLRQAKSESTIGSIKAKAAEISEHVNGILLPGGLDVEPEFYGQQREEGTHSDDDYRRSILEFALIQKAQERNIPLMGVCRGSQISNVYFGGSLKQHVERQYDMQALEPVNKAALDQIGVGEIFGLSMHHQANDKIGQGLSVVLKHDDIPKALMNEDGSILLTQFHPEAYYGIPADSGLPEEFTNNKKFFDFFVNKATAHRIKKPS